MNNENMNNEMNSMGQNGVPTTASVNTQFTPVNNGGVSSDGVPSMVAGAMPVSTAPTSVNSSGMNSVPVIDPASVNEVVSPSSASNSVDAVQGGLGQAQLQGQPTLMASPASGDNTNPDAQKKKNNLIIIIMAGVALLLVVCGIILSVIGNSNKNEEAPTPAPVVNRAQQKFLDLARKYVDAASSLWASDNLLCQNATNASEALRPSQLSSVDAYSGPAYYYLFIDSSATDELKLDVDDSRSVAGWVRIGKSDSSYYVALSDGVNYIVDKGTEFGVVFNNLTVDDVKTDGNGSFYQYLNGEIFGSNTDGNGWGIGDVSLLTDGDDSNNGIYMSNGKKTAGYTPFCVNVNS